MTREQLIARIRERQNFLCIGLDTDLQKIPAHFHKYQDPVFEFNKAIIDATSDLCVAYKPNLAFYEALGPAGWKSLEKTMEYIPDGIFTIADAKRGDIGNTSKLYARTFFSYFQFDAVTVAPYMGEDSVVPFLEFEDKWVILLCLTSNPGSRDFQQIRSVSGQPLFVSVLEKASQWGTPENLMFVVGATQPEGLKEVRGIVPDHFLLVPGFGAQGGDLDAVFSHGANQNVGLLVNSSRDILYAGSEEDFAVKARNKALEIQSKMNSLLSK